MQELPLPLPSGSIILGKCKDFKILSITLNSISQSLRRRVTQPVCGPATNNVAEFEAVTKAVRMAKSASLVGILVFNMYFSLKIRVLLFVLDLVKLKVFTDSKCVIICMTEWYPYWRCNGWRTSQGGPVINRQQVEELLDAMEGMQLKWVFVT